MEEITQVAKRWLRLAILILFTVFHSCSEEKVARRPNILFCIADDASYPHMGAYGCNWIHTPAFDRIAREGIMFTRCYTPNAKCAPSRSCILTGLNSWQLKAACNHQPLFPSEFLSFIETLGTHGYYTGFTGKGWAPGNPGTTDGRTRRLTGKQYGARILDPPTKMISQNDYSGNFRDFIAGVPEDTPWCFWYGGHEPHRAYEFTSGVLQGGKKTSDLGEIPGIWPDNDSVRHDLLDYAFEIEYFDKHLQAVLEELEARDQMSNTVIVVTADNGMPFPRIKGQEYEFSNHLPLAIMWPEGIKNPGRVEDDFVSFIDFAPTFIELAGLDWGRSGMHPSSPGKSLTPIFNVSNEERVKAFRDFVVFGKERHDVGRPGDQGYPIRGIVLGDFLYVKNFEPDRWPAGNPETGYLNCDGGAAKSLILNMRRRGEDHRYWDMSFGKRPEMELYNIKVDPWCIVNLAADEDMEDTLAFLQAKLFNQLTNERDPRMAGQGELFERYPFQGHASGFYERYLAGEEIRTGWVNKSDFEIQNIEER